MRKRKKAQWNSIVRKESDLDCIKDLTFRSLTDSCIECDYFNLIDLLRKYDYMKKEINKLKT